MVLLKKMKIFIQIKEQSREKEQRSIGSGDKAIQHKHKQRRGEDKELVDIPDRCVYLGNRFPNQLSLPLMLQATLDTYSIVNPKRIC